MHRFSVAVPRRFIWLGLWMTLLSAAAFATTQGAMLPVMLPMLAIGWCIAWGFTVVTPSDGTAPVDDIGAWFLMALGIYSLLPPAVYLGLGGHYTLLNDARLLDADPDPSAVGEIVRLYLMFAAAFTVAYCLARTRRVRSMHNAVPRPDRAFLVSAVAFFVFVRLFFLLLGMLYDLSSETYEGAYKALQQLPQLLAQAVNIMIRFRVVLNILLVAILFSDYRRWRLLIWGWVAFEIANQLMIGGPRSVLFFLLATVAIFYHLNVRRIRFAEAAVGAIGGLTAFQVLGLLRQAAGGGLAFNGFSALGTAGEFESLFANAYDLAHRTQAGEVHAPLSLYLSEVFSIIPSQFLPFEKQDFSLWYIKSFYPGVAERGGGFAFGIIPQALIGLGAAELIVRGVLTGLFFAAAQRYYVRSKSPSIWVVVTYAWLLIHAYTIFRNSNLDLLTPLLMGLVPAAIIVWTLRAILRAGFRREPGASGVTGAPGSIPG